MVDETNMPDANQVSVTTDVSDETESPGEPSPWNEVPLVPSTLAETGIPDSFLRELVLKTIWAHDMPTLGGVANITGLHARVVEELITGLSREGLCDVDKGSAAGTVQFRYRLSDRGKNAAHEALSRSRYVGKAPVPISLYNRVIAEQVRRYKRPPLADIRRALEHMVLPERLIEVIGQAFFSRRALMIFGPSGNGKTDIVTSIANIVAGTIVIPYALYGQGQLIRVFDPDVHRSLVEDEQPSEGLFADTALKHDQRWLPVHRPSVIVGGDMGAESLEMSYDATQGVHQAPLSVVAQGGVLVIDDLGRQKVSPKEILNRWVLMMEQGFDSFALSSSEIIRLPLDVTLVFSTNLTLQDLMDEAYLRRIAYKISIPNPTRDQLAEITRRYCGKKAIEWSEDGISYLMDRLFDGNRSPHGCFPRDIITTVIDEAEFGGRPPVLDRESIDTACALYLGHGDVLGEAAA
jgi:predicted ATPase with chaperone activity